MSAPPAVRTEDPAPDVPTGHPASLAHDGRLLHRRLPSHGWAGWIGPLLVTVLAGLFRLPHLGRPDAIVFDETYYVKDALALLRFGAEREAVEGADERILASDAPWDALDIFTDAPAFVVHPPIGKWVIATGEWAFGVTPFGWRFGVAVVGTLTVLMTARIVRRLTRSDVVGTVAGLLVALDGLHIVMSRTALLDITLMALVLAAFGLLLLDRDTVRRRLDERRDEPPGLPVAGAGPRLGWRPWRLAAGVALGLACGVKWSGLWYVAAFGLLTVAWDVQLRRALGVARPLRAVARRDVLPAFLSIVPVALAVYVATWAGWLLTDGGYDRDWAASNPGGWPLLPDALRSLAAYHQAAWRFHVGLDSAHSYQSSAWSWPFMSRPTSFAFEREGLSCGPDCRSAVLAVGNPVIWWAGLLALVHNAWRAVAARDWRSGALLVGYLTGWVPWLVFHERTIFTFYAIVLVPFLAGMLAISLARLPGGADASPTRRRFGLIAAALVLLAVVGVAWFLMPIWTGAELLQEQWRLRMWLPTWV